jgi:methionine synthase I (cobalamin-dependent)
MNTIDLITRLNDRCLLFDGAMGTQLIAAGLTPADCGVLWNVERPDAIEAIHRRYLDAGCDVVTTNTFQASRTALATHGLSDRAAELCRAAATVARRAAGDARLVAADIGPFGGFVEPLGDTSVDELTDIVTEQLAALRDGGADLALVETMSDPAELAVSVRAARQLGDWPIIATFAYQAGGDPFVTMMGTTVAGACAAAVDAGADVVGANCGTALDLEAYAKLGEQLVAAAGQVPVIVQPNAGAPIERDGQMHHPATPDDMADLARKLRDAGVKIIGGCCGTTPDHLHAMHGALRT